MKRNSANNPAAALLLYVLFVFAGGALIAPWIYQAISHSWPNIPFRRVVDRCLIILAIAGLWPLVKALGVTSANEIGLRTYPTWKQDLWGGLRIGSALVLTAIAASRIAGAFDWDATRHGWHVQVASAAATAIVVAIIEEILFRGAIFTALRRVSGTTTALWISSAIYGIFHFYARPENPAHIEWTSGFIVLGRMFAGFADFRTVVPGFFSLTLLGVIFTLAFIRTGALYMSIGIHGALIFWVKLFGFAANTSPGANTWFWGTEKLIDGWFCFFLLLAATIAFAKFDQLRRSRREETLI